MRIAVAADERTGIAETVLDELRRRGHDPAPHGTLRDSKRDDWQDVIERAPQITAHLSDASSAHFERVQRQLDALGIADDLAPRLVRGFDYYTGTTFEFQSGALDAAQNAIGGGGRYGKLAEEMGGKPTSGIGFGIGVERVLIACDAEGSAFTATAPSVDAFVVSGLGRDGDLRENGVRTERAYGDRSVRAQWKVADKAGATYGVMLGAQEAARGAVAVKDLRTAEQVEVPRELLAGWLRERVETQQ